MDALRQDDLERARSTAPGEKLRQALELMKLGIELLATGPVDVPAVRRLLALIESRGFAGGQDLDAKLDTVIAASAG